MKNPRTSISKSQKQNKTQQQQQKQTNKTFLFPLGKIWDKRQHEFYVLRNYQGWEIKWLIFQIKTGEMSVYFLPHWWGDTWHTKV